MGGRGRECLYVLAAAGETHPPAVDNNRVVPTSPLDTLHVQHAVDNCSWIAGLAITGPAQHLELGHIVSMSTL